MQLTQYSNGVKTFNKADVIKEINVQRDFQEKVLSTLRLAHSNGINLEPYCEKWSVTKSILDQGFKKHQFQNDLMDGIANISKRWETILKAAEDVVKGEENIIDGTTLTVRQANVLLVIDNSNFYCDFVMQMVDVLLTMALKDQTPERSGIPKANLDFLNKTHGYFLDVFMQVYTDDAGVIKRLKDGADVEVDETALDVLSRGKGENAIRSFATRNIGIHYFLPMYWIKTMRMKLDLSRIRKMRESSELAAMKIEQLSNRQNNQMDPKLDRQIQVYQERIIKNSAEIAEIEASYE